jgi:hypothetical protein
MLIDVMELEMGVVMWTMGKGVMRKEMAGSRMFVNFSEKPIGMEVPKIDVIVHAIVHAIVAVMAALMMIAHQMVHSFQVDKIRQPLSRILHHHHLVAGHIDWSQQYTCHHPC